MLKENPNTKLFDEAYKNVRMGSFAIDCIMPAVEENKDLNDLLVKQNKNYLKSVEQLENLSNETKESLKNSMTDLANDIVEKVIGYRSEIQGYDNKTVDEILYQ